MSSLILPTHFLCVPIQAESRAQHQRMGDSTQRMRGQNDAVRGALAQAMDTEDVALGITEQLHANRETIMSARRKAKDTASLTDKVRPPGLAFLPALTALIALITRP